MKTTKKLIIAAAALPMLFTAGAFAKGGHDMDGRGGKGGDKFMKLVRQLDLTEEQKDQFRDMREAKREEMKANRDTNQAERMAEKQAQHAAIQDLVLADTFDEAKAQELATAMVEKQTERRVQRLAQQHEMLSILTDEQKAELKELQAERMENMSERMEKRKNK
jgi:protein CpxP